MLPVADKAAKESADMGGADETTTMTPTQRSLKLLRERGYMVEIVERWVPFTPKGFRGPLKRHDCFNVADMLAVKDNEVLLVQTTDGTSVSKHVDKLREAPITPVWNASPNRRLVVHGWAKRGERGKRKTWTCREVEV